MSDIRDTLAQLDRRLADLRHQIGDLVQEPEPAPPPPPSAHRTPPPPTPQAIGPGLDDAPWAGAAAADAPTARARAAAQGVNELGAQLQQLLTMRERLLGDARSLLRIYERQLQTLEAQDTSELELLTSQLTGRGAPQSATEGRTAGESRPAFFEGTVTVTAGGAHRIQTIEVMEDSLSRVRRVEQVYLRRWHAGRVSFELKLAAGVELIGELNRVLPFPFAVQSATGQEIVITLDGER